MSSVHRTMATLRLAGSDDYAPVRVIGSRPTGTGTSTIALNRSAVIDVMLSPRGGRSGASLTARDVERTSSELRGRCGARGEEFRME